VNVRGVDLALTDIGDGPALIWGHGLTSCRAQDDQMGLLPPALPPDRFRLVRYDARGHGESEGTTDPADYSYLALAQDQLALADALGLDRFAAGGASLGAGTALHTAVLAPERVWALLVVIPPTGWAGREERGAWYVESARIAEEEGTDVLTERALAEPVASLFAPFASEILKATRERYSGWDPAVLAALLRGVGGSDLPPEDEVAGITAPTLVLAWVGDHVHPVATAERLGELIPHAEVHVSDSLRDLTTWGPRALEFLEGAAQ
jgi:3-oxoadipate enol-lactonase